MKRKEQFQCNQCDELTRLDIKTKRLTGDIRHSYAQCEKCGYKSTVYYTNKRVRKLMSKQATETNVARKEALKGKLQREIDMLKVKFETEVI